MAAFCTKCGGALTPGSGFCSSCGTPVAASAAPVPPPASTSAAPAQRVAPPAAYGPPPPAAYPAAPPQGTSNVLKIILIVIAVVVGLGVLGAGAMGFMAWRVAKSISVDGSGKGATVSVPGVGSVTAGGSTATAAELGVPLYPGALQKQGGVNVDSPQTSMVSAQFSTNDSPSQVVDFYKASMGDSAVAVSTGDGTVLTSGSSDNDRIMVTIGPSSNDATGKTTILVMHTKKK